MFYKTLGLWLFICFNIAVFGQNNFQIKGFVGNATTSKPIQGATITSKSNLYALSNEAGEFVMYNVPEGTYTLTISHVAYASKTITVNVNSKTNKVSILLDTKTTNLDEIVVKGKTKEEIEHETPMVSELVSKEFLLTNRENSLMQTLSKIPGVGTVNIGSGQSKPIIRGLGFNRVSVVQNGIKHEAQQWGNDHGLEIDQYGIENISIIKGAASLLYGSDAIAGVVDIQPAKIPLLNSFTGEVNLLAESNNDLLGVSVGLQSRKEKWYYRTRLTYRDYADYKVPTDKINYESYVFELHNNQLRNTAGFEANAAFSVGYIGENFKTETFFSNVNAKNGFFANAHGLEVRTSTIDYDSDDRDIDLPYHKVNHFKIVNNSTYYANAHTFHIEAGFQNNHREEHSEPVPHGFMPKPDNSKERVFYKNTISLNVRDVYKPNENHDIVFGINTEYQNNNIGGWGFLIPEYNRFTAGIFAFDHFDIYENLHFQGGLRYDFGTVKTKSYTDWFQTTVNNPDGSKSNIYLQRAQNKTLNFNSVSGSVGLSYTAPKTTYKLNVGKSFRIPLANELASDGVNYHMYRFERGNLDLDPEASYQIDAEIDYVSSKFSFGISPFVNFFENFIYLNPTPNFYETLQIYEYTQTKVFRYGGELNLNYNILKNLNLNTSVEYVYSKQTTGPKKNFTIPFSPPLSGLISASYQINKDILFFKNLQFFADYRITAKQNDIVPPEEKTKGYQLLNLSVLSNLNVLNAQKPAQLRFKVNNVFNKEYFNHTSFYRLIDVPEPGRNISISLTIPF
ncbi:TonB-dependent receptor [Seonamhaeicola algicola]|uniref:TonB-dependent receptor n=1 Tax=Seonamhaeicola algicola TaxID=1719036 RepID=A0A5C7AU67_9FLAO|nr:TonB-dependent receptor [Seonamhaeicola algicola]TXE11931.1 TonB-dependent receptor [Seonamhaeicola algicola]